MGIKGIYRELGPGQRISLSKLAADSYQQHGRPFRIAVDIAIWQFQAQAARGGSNPAIRTLFFRLLRLLGTPIQPIFVFDGPQKPTFKRNKRSGRGDTLAAEQAKRLIRLFGFATHDAPGEAEAECALLQSNGIVDAVLSEDVDTIMFGCTKTLRNWSAEGKGNTPTHVSLYDTDRLNIAETGLDREGMVLVALMSGGDYLPEGIPNCGVKLACEAAKAGFGKSICRLKASDDAGLRAWREELIHELRTNESRYFRTKHKALGIPDTFPNIEVLRYYTHPVVSPLANLPRIRERLNKTGDPDILGLREFTRESFAWDFQAGAIYLVRKLAPALLVHRLCKGHPEAEGYIQRITGRRIHFSTDATPELRLSYIPQDIVPIDISQEVENTAYGRDGLALNSDDEFEAPDSASQSSQAAGKIYDVSKPDLAWVLEEVARKTAPAAIQNWEAAEHAKATKKAPKKTAGARSKKAAAVPSSTLDQFVKVSKPQELPSGLAAKAASDSAPAPKDLREQPKPVSRRSKTPTREPSKQPSTKRDYASGDPFTRPIASSPVAPRTPVASFAEPILISSSPQAAPSSPSPKPRVSSRSQNAGSFPRVLATSQEAVSRSSRSKRREHFTPKASQEGRFKQTTLDIFATRSRLGAATSTCAQKSRVAEDFSDYIHNDAVEIGSSPPRLPSPAVDDIFSSPLQPSTPGRCNQIADQDADCNVPKSKRILVPRTSAIGFFKEVEVEEDDLEQTIARETARLRSRGMETAVARWSDVSVIDLTQDDA